MAKKTARKAAKKSSGKRVEKEKVTEYFHVEKDGKEKTVKAEGSEEVHEFKSKKQVYNENKILIWMFIICGLLLGFVIGGYFFVQDLNGFEYRGLEFDIIRTGEVTFYHTSMTLDMGDKKVDYQIYLRNDPRELEKKIPFEGEELILHELAAINSTNDFVCDGYGGAAMYNFRQIVNTFGTEITSDPAATCDEEGRYTYIEMNEGNESAVRKTGPSCYEFGISNCEITKVTERFLVETIVKANIINELNKARRG